VANINLPLDETLLKILDRTRGDVARVVFIRRAIEEKCHVRPAERPSRPTRVRSSASARANAKPTPKGGKAT
jgi:hypothetical protein